jgi:hypothetical protein
LKPWAWLLAHRGLPRSVAAVARSCRHHRAQVLGADQAGFRLMARNVARGAHGEPPPLRLRAGSG